MDSVQYIRQVFLGFPEGKMSLTWEQLSVETHLRNIVTSEVDDLVIGLETLHKRDITPTSFNFVYNRVEGLMLDLKEIHASFRKKVADAKLLQNEQFIEDSRAMVKWQLETWNKLDKLRPKSQNLPATNATSNLNAQGNALHDTLFNLDRTLQKHNDERETNTNINKPHFKGGKEKEHFLKFERFQKDFKTFSRNIRDKVRLLQLLRDTLSGHARNQIEELDLTEANYDLAWKKLEAVYAKKEECRGILIDKIFSFQFNMSADKIDECFSNYCILIEKLLTSHNIDLLNEEAGMDTVLSHLTFKKLPQSLRNVILNLSTTHYPTFAELKVLIPKAVDRLRLQSGENNDVLNCNSVTLNKGVKQHVNKYCLFCQKDNHFSSDCTKFSTFHDRVNKLKELKKCSFCGKKGHFNKKECGPLKCSHCHKTCHRVFLCLDNLKTLQCNKGKTDDELYDLSKVKRFQSKNMTSVTTATTVANSISSCSTALPYAIVQVVIKNYLTDCKVLFDQGSQITLISKRFVNKFNLKSNGSKTMKICGVTGDGMIQPHKTYPISIQTNTGIVEINAMAYDNLPVIQMPGYNKIINDLKLDFNDLAKYPKNADLVETDLLLGCDNYFKLVENSECKNYDTLTLIPTKVGKIPCGPYNIVKEPEGFDKFNQNFVYSNFLQNNINNACELYTRHNLNLRPTDEINKNLVLSKIFTMENLATNKEVQEMEEKLAYENFEKEIFFDTTTQQYCVPLLFRGGFPPDPKELPTNFNLTSKRHNSLKAQLDLPKNESTRQELQKLCLKERELQFIEPIDQNKIDTTFGHFLPAVLVKKDSQTTPLRRCFDCSARMKGKNSLNDMLFAGPNLVPKLFDIIIRSRFKRYFLLCDISKAFLRLQLITKYRDFVKIILREDWNDPKSKDIYYRFKTVLFGSTCSPFLLQATIAYHLKKIGMEYLLENLFVDDISLFSNDIDELLTWQNDAVKAFNKISMPLSKYVSNNPEVTKKLVARGVIEKPQSTCKLLGMNINLSTDSFIINLPNFNVTNPTLTTVMSDHASVWDVLGLIEPVRVASKIFLNSLFKDKLEMNSKLNNEQKSKWKEIVHLYKSNVGKNFSRMCIVNPDEKHRLHMFTDASSVGYGSVAFVSTVSENPSSLFLTAKSKLKGSTVKSTIPKLELSGILFGIELLDRLVTILNKSFKFESIHLWSDAKVPLTWITQANQHSVQYIQSRAKQARTLIEKHNIKLHYVESKLNPADLLTKDFNQVYSNLPLWMRGPPCIREQDFPIFKEIEIKEEHGNPDQNIYVNLTFKNEEILARVKEVSTFNKLLNITHILKNAGEIIISHKIKDNPKSDPKLPSVVNLKNGPRLYLPEILPDEVNTLFFIWIKYYQSIYFTNYLNYFKKKRQELGQGCQCCLAGSVNKETDMHILNGYTKFGNLNVVIDNKEVLRVKTRSSDSFSFNYKFPILLPKKAHFSYLYAAEIHRIEGHVGASQTLSLTRNKVWIVNGRGVANKVIKSCWICRLQMPKMYRTPSFPNLPESRMIFSKPFSNIGIDMSGHYILFNKGKSFKRYVLIITCLSTRAVHALLCRDNSVGAFVHCLRRHIFRYGSPNTILTDNAKNFHSLNSILESHSRNNIVKQILRVRGIVWKFTASYSPWAGAVYESIVKIIKKILKKTFNSKKMGVEDMVTLICHAEYVANNRPISYVTQNDTYQILTPNMLIFGRPLNQENWLDSDQFKDPDYTLISQKDLGETFKKLRNSMSIIERDFNTLYLDALRERDAKQLESKCTKKRNVIDRRPEVGDVVLLCDDKGRPTQVSRIVDIDKKDGSEIRSCKIILKNSANWWPVSRIAFFEVGSPDSIPKKFNPKIKLPDKNIVFSRKKLERLAKKNIKYTE